MVECVAIGVTTRQVHARVGMRSGSALMCAGDDYDRPRPTTIDHDRPRPTTTDHDRPRPTTTDHDRPRLTFSQSRVFANCTLENVTHHLCSSAAGDSLRVVRRAGRGAALREALIRGGRPASTNT